MVYTRFVYSTNAPVLIGELHLEHKPAVPGSQPGFGRPSGCCLEGDQSVEVTPELRPGTADLVIDKHGYDAFHGTPLDAALRRRGIDHLVVTGVMTDICVLATISGGMNLGYKMTVVRDGVATLWPPVQAACLDIIERAYARVRSGREVENELRNLCSR